MPKRVPLPTGLPPAFTVAQGRQLGLGRGRLASADLLAPFHGVRSVNTVSVRAASLERTIASCRAFAPLLGPHHVFSHTTAALMWGCPLPRSEDEQIVLHVTSLRPARACDRRGVIGHQIDPAQIVVTRRYGLPITDPAATFMAMSSKLGLDDLVVVGDHFILSPAILNPRDIRPHITHDALRAAVAASSGRGCVTARGAMALVREGAESPRETQLRLLLLRAGLPDAELNIDIRSSSGNWLGRADLVFRRWKVIVEYDGDQHRTDIRQYERDIERSEGFEADGWKHIRVRSRGLGSEASATVRRVTTALLQRGWLP